jgi:hypothetical protein
MCIVPSSMSCSMTKGFVSIHFFILATVADHFIMLSHNEKVGMLLT